MFIKNIIWITGFLENCDLVYQKWIDLIFYHFSNTLLILIKNLLTKSTHYTGLIFRESQKKYTCFRIYIINLKPQFI